MDDALKTEPLVLRDDMLGDSPLQNADAIVSSAAVSPLPDASTLITHLARWTAWNFDPSQNKADLHVDQTYHHFVDSTNVLQFNIGTEAANAFKCQLHAVQFTTTLGLDTLIGLFDGFAGLNDPTVAGCTKLSPTAKLTLMDEFRWRIPLPSDVINGISAALTSAVTAISPASPIAFPAIRAIVGQITERRFDIRVVGLDGPTASLPQFTLTVQTLADHPYGGRRAWRVKPTRQTINGLPEYRLETVEFNSYSWLPDYLGEKWTNGDQARLTWKNFLTQYVTVATGTITDSSLIKGQTVPSVVGSSQYSSRRDSLNALLSDQVMLQIISDYPTLSLEVDRQKAAFPI